jgi:hypothetical protein
MLKTIIRVMLQTTLELQFWWGKKPFDASCLFGPCSFKYKMQAQNPAHAQNNPNFSMFG